MCLVPVVVVMVTVCLYYLVPDVSAMLSVEVLSVQHVLSGSSSRTGDNSTFLCF